MNETNFKTIDMGEDIVKQEYLQEERIYKRAILRFIQEDADFMNDYISNYWKENYITLKMKQFFEMGVDILKKSNPNIIARKNIVRRNAAKTRLKHYVLVTSVNLDINYFDWIDSYIAEKLKSNPAFTFDVFLSEVVNAVRNSNKSK